MKKKIIISSIIFLLLIILSISIYLFIDNKNNLNNVELNNILETEFLNKVKVSSFIKNIKGTIVDDYEIDTSTLGTKEITFTYLNENNRKKKNSFNINVVDTTSPLIWLSGSYSVNQGTEVDLTEKIMCGDIYDSNPKKEIIGEYDLNTVGTYPLTFKATDNQGNTSQKDFNLIVKEAPKSSGGSSTGSSSSRNRTEFADVIANYKTENTEIGLDISKWQGDVDFNALKEAGVEFVFIRVGSANGMDKDRFVDSKFIQNIEGANAAGIPVGIYYYSYAHNIARAKEDASWIIEQIKDYKVDLPIAFDWENWSSFNKYNLSFFELTKMAEAYLDVFKESGYEGLLYSSKTYLENIWLDTSYPKWLAHYTTNTNYEGDFDYWQLCSNGRVNGINGDVDINIRYLSN